MRAAIDGIAKAAASLSDSVGPEASSQKGGGPLSVLVPAEIPFLLRVYDEAQAHVGAENLAVARSLHGKGAVLRTDAPESGVISQCDVTLAPEWVPIMRARADELRAELE